MQRNRAIAIVLGFILFLVFIGILLSLAFGGGGKKTPSSTPTAKVLTLPDYASTTAVASMTIDGRVNGDDLHRAVRITIGQNQREVDIIQGYSGHVLSSQTFYNTQDAYAVFLRAINYGGFGSTLKTKTPAPADERGLCATGDRYIFSLDQYGSNISRLWASDCGSKVGMLGGNSGLLQELFEAQIPQYNTIVENVEL